MPETPPTVTHGEVTRDHAADETGPASFTLQIVEPDAAPRIFSTDEVAFSIGSHPSNGLVLKDGAVSRFHGEVSIRDGAVTLRDLDSRNGTFVDGVRVKEAFLRLGAGVQLGRTTLRVGPAAAATARLSSSTSFGRLVGSSPAMRAVYAVLERAAGSLATVLLDGETGTGKGAAALALHQAGPRRAKPFVVVDCGSIPENLFESELFGHERGAFTGAESPRAGAFEAAHEGTVFLDEVGELPLDVQPKLLRALEERQIRRLGATQHRPIDVRIVAATNRDLRTAVNDGSFRADLYYRLAVVRTRIPPLRERPEDLPVIVAELVAALGGGEEERRALTRPGFVAGLARHPWPGNVRELRNHLERCLVLDDPHGEPPESGAPESFQDARTRALTAFERQYLQTLMDRHDGKVAAAAQAAGLSRVYLYRLLARHRLLRGEP